ncbi:MAG: biotin--[acetyl-CoA-carboxylase] ligase [Actinomycetota bacterium]|nr:biotin--[acetyl-CoA-carboxylase] ligase [Actinomycetota bacterium]
MIKKIYFSEIESTNDYAVKNIEHIQNKTVIIADVQTKGKGRNGRSWFSEKNNLLVSLVLKPQINSSDISGINTLVHYAAVILSRVFKKKYNLDTEIKWPNDLRADGRKIAGILTEAVIKGDCVQGIIIGIGVNLNMNEKTIKKINQPATSLNILTGVKINKDEFLDFFLNEFFLEYNKFLEQGFSLIEEEYKMLSMVLGKKVRVVVSDKEYCGIAKDIDNKGQLVLNCNDKEEIINIGDILC